MLAHCCNHTVVTTILPSAILITGLLGSWHCLGMCGGLVTAMCHSATDLALYHFGRLLGYMGLGVAAGSLGYWIGSTPHDWLAILAAVIMAIALISNGILVIRGRHSVGATLPVAWVFKRITQAPSCVKPCLTGLLSVLLPCGWLYSIVLSLTLVQQPLFAAFIMAAFWLGTLPILTVSPVIIRLLARRYAGAMPWVMGILMISGGLYSLGRKFWG